MDDAGDRWREERKMICGRTRLGSRGVLLALAEIQSHDARLRCTEGKDLDKALPSPSSLGTLSNLPPAITSARRIVLV